jgi:glutamine synthetase
MIRDPITMFCYGDFSGRVRGKGIPARDLRRRLEKGIGWTPTNIMITAYGPIANTPWGPFGDLLLMPDPKSEVYVDFEDGTPPEHFFLSDVVETDLSPWEVCPRTFLRKSLERLRAETGLEVVASFEHEFLYSGANERPGDGYALDALRRAGAYGEVFAAALDRAGVPVESYMPEYAEAQFEVTVPPADGMTAADRAVILREIAQAAAWRLGETVSFAPLPAPDKVGNGVHVHISLKDAEGRPVMYDPEAPHGLSAQGAAFTAGIVRHMPAITAIAAPSVVSYMRLRPNRWSACWTNLGDRDREAGVRICPFFATPGASRSSQYNIEYRAADATANPHLVLATLINAGLQGLKEGLPAPSVSDGDPAAMDAAERDSRGIRLLPQSLGEALDALKADAVASAWFPPEMLHAYERFKRGEIDLFEGLDPEEQCRKTMRAH